MAYFNPGRPVEDEYPPLLAGHVNRVPEGDIIALLDRQLVDTERLLTSYTASQAAWRPAPGEWNAIEITGHLADIERVHTNRAFVVARGDTGPLAGMNPVAYMAAAHFAARPLADVTAELLAVRGATLALFRGLDAAAWARCGSVLGAAISVRALAYIIAGHHLLHFADLERHPDLADRVAVSVE